MLFKKLAQISLYLVESRIYIFLPATETHTFRISVFRDLDRSGAREKVPFQRWEGGSF